MCSNDGCSFGARITARVGVVVCLAGYLVLWLSTAAFIMPQVGVMMFGAFVAFAGNSFFDTVRCARLSGYQDDICVRDGQRHDVSISQVAISMNMNNFANDRGRVAGLLKSFVGLSGAIMASWYNAFFVSDVPTFMLFLAVRRRKSISETQTAPTHTLHVRRYAGDRERDGAGHVILHHRSAGGDRDTPHELWEAPRVRGLRNHGGHSGVPSCGGILEQRAQGECGALACRAAKRV